MNGCLLSHWYTLNRFRRFLCDRLSKNSGSFLFNLYVGADNTFTEYTIKAFSIRMCYFYTPFGQRIYPFLLIDREYTHFFLLVISMCHFRIFMSLFLKIFFVYCLVVLCVNVCHMQKWFHYTVFNYQKTKWE